MISNADLVELLERMFEMFKKESNLVFGCSYNGSEEDDVFVRYSCFICNNVIYSIDENVLLAVYKNASVAIDNIVIDKRDIDSF